LERIENDSKEKIDTTKFSIEHIMPQNENLRKEWKGMLGDNWQLVHQTWLHRLGNLTLTGYNSEYSDKDYQTKKTITGGFNESPLRLNRDMRDSEVWTEGEMIARAERLANKSIELWPLLTVPSRLISEYTLEERKHLSHGKTTSDVSGFNDDTIELFNQLESYINNIASDASLILGKKNLTFYTLEPFLQVIPRSRKLAIVMSLEYENIPTGMQEICSDTHEWSFIPNASLSGVYCEIEQEEDLTKFKELIRLAYEEALS
jgi:predicted transport protein